MLDHLGKLFNFDAAILATARSSLVSLVKSVATLVASKQKVLKGKEAIAGVLLIAIGTHVYYWNKYSYWRRRGVKGPPPIPFFGNFLSFLRNPRQRLDRDWTREYGKIYGYYMGLKPYLVVADAAVLRKICIKDFDKFPNHFFVAIKNKYQKHFLIIQRDDHWRGMRAVFTPTFTSGKIKYMFKVLEGCANELIDLHKDRLQVGPDGTEIGTINARAVMGAFSMGSALSSFYGVSLEHEKADCEADPRALTKDNFAERSNKALTANFKRFVATHLVPACILKLLNFPLIPEKPLHFFEEQAERIITRRQKSGQRYNDYLQLLLEARSDVEMEVAESDDKERHHALDIDTVTNDGAKASKTSKKLKLTKDELYSSTMMLMMVATETTATLLANTLYLLAYHPDIQERLYEELMKVRVQVDTNSNFEQTSTESFKFDYEGLTSCEYLDCVVSESLRLMSPVIALDREASEDYYVEEYGITIPKGTVIFLAFYTIMRDPDYWPEPEKFDPERFRPHNRDKIIPGSYCPFGIGPRSCIGFRFGLTEAKIALAKMLCQFKYSPGPGTVYPPHPRTPSYIQNDCENLLVSYKPRV